MKNRINIYLVLLFTSFTFPYVQAQVNNYELRAAQIRKEIWSWDNTGFQKFHIPEEHKNESFVILARHRQIDATARAFNFFNSPVSGKLFYSDTDRRMIKINDQAALDIYSEFAFREEEKYKFYGNTNSALNILGARIIKPDGTINEIDVSKQAVSVTEGKNDKESFKKLAIPELQVNDILDFFICELYELESLNLTEQVIPFYSLECPALKYSCSLKFGKNLTVEFRSINNAPEVIKTYDQHGNTILTAESNDLMRINDYKNIRWLSSLRDLPMIRFVVLQNASRLYYKPESARPVGVFENVPEEMILKDATGFLAFSFSKLNTINTTYTKVVEIVDNYKNTYSTISKEELANIIYTALNFAWPVRSTHYHNSATFTLILGKLFNKYDIENKTGFATSKYMARRNELLSHEDLIYTVIANEGSQYFFLPYRYRIPGEIPAYLQAERASTYKFKKIGTKQYNKMEVKGEWGEHIIFPESTAEQNANKTQAVVSFHPEDIYKLYIERSSSWSGSSKEDIQPLLILFEDWDREMRHYLRIRKSYTEQLNEKRKTRRLIAEAQGHFEKQREKHIESQKEEIIIYHDREPEEIKDFSFASLGVNSTSPNLKYNISYVMSGFVRKAGENIILDAGKLIGKQWDPTDNDRIRNVDAYLPTRRTFESEITILIPENYKVTNIDGLNINYSNEYASFEATTLPDTDKIIIKTKKTYLMSFIPKENWNYLIDIIDSTNEFYSKSIVFEKNTKATDDGNESL